MVALTRRRLCWPRSCWPPVNFHIGLSLVISDPLFKRGLGRRDAERRMAVRINRSEQRKQRPNNLNGRCITWLSHRKGEPFGLLVQNRSSSSSVASVTSCSNQLPFLE